MVVINNIIDLNEYILDKEKTKELKNNITSDNNIIIVYNGSLGLWNDPKI